MYSVDQDRLQFESYFGWLEGEFCGRSEALNENWDKDLGPIVPNLKSYVLDDENVGELSEANGGVVKAEGGGVPNGVKSAAALKSHSESERRRRERINSRLETLRGLVPSKEKMDKAAILAEVVNQVKHLKKTAAAASKGLFIPTDSDEVQVEYLHSHNNNNSNNNNNNNNAEDGALYFKASICFELIPEFLSELKRTIGALQVTLVKAEISTLGNRTKYDMLLKKDNNKKNKAPEVVQNSIHEALTSVFDKVSLILEYSPRTTMPSNKRQKISCLRSSSLSA